MSEPSVALWNGMRGWAGGFSHLCSVHGPEKARAFEGRRVRGYSRKHTYRALRRIGLCGGAYFEVNLLGIPRLLRGS